MSETIRTLEDLKEAGDQTAFTLLHTDHSDWVRSQLGIIGRVDLPPNTTAAALREELDTLIATAYADLDALPTTELSSDDLWNLLLFIGVPWSEGEALRLPEIHDQLQRCATDLKGSRKIILWRNTSMLNHLGPLGTSGRPWEPPAGDPVVEELGAVAADDTEKEALQILLLRKIPEHQMDDLIGVLGRLKGDR